MDHTLALIMKSQQGDKEARDTVFKENAGLVYSMAKRFAGRSALPMVSSWPAVIIRMLLRCSSVRFFFFRKLILMQFLQIKFRFSLNIRDSLARYARSEVKRKHTLYLRFGHSTSRKAMF